MSEPETDKFKKAASEWEKTMDKFPSEVKQSCVCGAGERLALAVKALETVKAFMSRALRLDDFASHRLDRHSIKSNIDVCEAALSTVSSPALITLIEAREKVIEDARGHQSDPDLKCSGCRLCESLAALDSALAASLRGKENKTK